MCEAEWEVMGNGESFKYFRAHLSRNVSLVGECERQDRRK